MKIRYIFIVLAVLFSTFCFSESGKCAYLESNNGFINTPKNSFGYYYNIQLCKEFEPITEDAVKYVQSIKQTKGKNIREVVTEIGNTLCRGSFGECGEKAFYDRYMVACENARENAKEDLAKYKKIDKKALTIPENDEIYAMSFTKCEPLANSLLQVFKDVAGQEAAKYHDKIIESSSSKYLKPSYELMQKLSNTMGTIIKKIGSTARSFEGFIRNVYNTGFTTN